jgi:hypothetical protein
MSKNRRINSAVFLCFKKFVIHLQIEKLETKNYAYGNRKRKIIKTK